MLTIVYSFNKTGFEAEYWQREIAAASDDEFTFVPFDHGVYLDPSLYLRAQLLDNLFAARDPRLARLYGDFERLVRERNAAAMIVDNCPPYHPEYLRRQSLYKVLRIADGPLSAYDRDFAYLHAYDHVLYHSPAYSAELSMREKLEYCRAPSADFWPLALFDAAFDPRRTEDELVAATRDVDVVFVGALHPNKMPLLASVKKALGRRFVMRGLGSLKKNVYFNLKYGFPGWVRPLPAREYVPLYQRAKIGINVHNRGDYTVGSFRLFELPANGVMQISDGGQYLDAFFERGREVIAYGSTDELVDQIRYYLAHDDERQAIVRNGYRRVIGDHRIGKRLREAAGLIRQGLDRRTQGK